MRPLQPCTLGKRGLCREQAQPLPGPRCPTSVEDVLRPAAAVTAPCSPEQAPRASPTRTAVFAMRNRSCGIYQLSLKGHQDERTDQSHLSVRCPPSPRCAEHWAKGPLCFGDESWAGGSAAVTFPQDVEAPALREQPVPAAAQAAGTRRLLTGL